MINSPNAKQKCPKNKLPEKSLFNQIRPLHASYRCSKNSLENCLTTKVNQTELTI